MKRTRIIGIVALIAWLMLFTWLDTFGADGRTIAGVVLTILVFIIIYSVVKEQR